MATPRLTNTKPAATAKHITAAARDVFLTEGYEAASMDAIARQADVSKATLYAHFASKETLFIAVMDEQKEEFREQLEHIANDPSGDLTQQLTRAGISLLTYLLSDATVRMFRVVFSEGGRIPDICQTFLRTTRQHSYNRFAKIFGNGTEPGKFSQQECEEAAYLFLAMLRGDLVWNCLVNSELHPTPADIESRVASVVKLMTKVYVPYSTPDTKRGTS